MVSNNMCVEEKNQIRVERSTSHGGWHKKAYLGFSCGLYICLAVTERKVQEQGEQ